jgi:tetratricopeptide (TPR) repeat protein
MFRAYKLSPSGKYAGEMAWLHLQFNKDCTLALSYFEEAERKDYARERPDLFYWMGACYENIGMYNSAKTYYRRFLDTAPGHEKQPEAETALGRLERY